MLIARGPRGFHGGRVSDALVSQIDIYPTLCGLAGIEPPQFVQGRSLLGLVRREVDEVNEEIFAELTYHAAYEPQRAIRTKRFKYIRRFADRETPVLPNVDDSPSKDVLIEHGWAERPVAREQLYDLVFDPGGGHEPRRRPGLRGRPPRTRRAPRPLDAPDGRSRCSTGRWRPRRALSSTSPASARHASRAWRRWSPDAPEALVSEVALEPGPSSADRLRRVHLGMIDGGWRASMMAVWRSSPPRSSEGRWRSCCRGWRSPSCGRPPPRATSAPSVAT